MKKGPAARHSRAIERDYNRSTVTKQMKGLQPVTSAELLELAAEALEDGRDPLTNPFLSDHDVTLDQCYDLADLLATGARIVAYGIRNPRSEQATAMFMTMAKGAS